MAKRCSFQPGLHAWSAPVPAISAVPYARRAVLSLQLTAQSNFTHNIRVRRDERHALVTHGIYRSVWAPCLVGAACVVIYSS